jgi:hypothetical protein
MKKTNDLLKTWTPTIAPAGMVYYFSSRIPQWNNSLLFVSLKGRSLRSLKLSDNGSQIINEEIFFAKHKRRQLNTLLSRRRILPKPRPINYQVVCHGEKWKDLFAAISLVVTVSISNTLIRALNQTFRRFKLLRGHTYKN